MATHLANIERYFETLARIPKETVATLSGSRTVSIDEGFDAVMAFCRRAQASGDRVLFVGNGGSAAIASHMANDFTNRGLRGVAFNDAVGLTCLGNDFGFTHVFARQIEDHARSGDVLIAISSSGESANILNAVAAARDRGCSVVTYSGFAETNRLRRLGDVNFYVPFDAYGLVEIAHFSLCHSLIDLADEARPGRSVNGNAPHEPIPALPACGVTSRSPAAAPAMPPSLPPK